MRSVSIGHEFLSHKTQNVTLIHNDNRCYKLNVWKEGRTFNERTHASVRERSGVQETLATGKRVRLELIEQTLVRYLDATTHDNYTITSDSH